jgi:peptide/nickel transport system substrate-binding protein
MRGRFVLFLAACVALALALAACGGTSETSAPPPAGPAPSEPSPAEPSPAEPSPAEPAAPAEEPAPSEPLPSEPEPSEPAPPPAEPEGEIVTGGILRVGSTDHIDSLNPFVAFNAQAYVAFTMVYPVLVQYAPGYEFEGDWAESWEVSEDGLTWTFRVKPGAWSDGTPLTAEDGAWSCNTILEHRKGPTANLAPFLSHVKECTAPDPQTLVIAYEQQVGNVLPQLQQFFVLPKHVWEPIFAADPTQVKKVKPAQSLPLVGGGAFTITKFEPKGVTIYEKNPGYYGRAAYVDAVGLQIFTNEDAMVAAFTSGELDVVDEVPFNAVASLESDPNVVVTRAPGFQVNNFIFNSNPDKPKNRELLDPSVREAFAHAIDRQAIADTAYAGLAKPWPSIVAEVLGDWVSPELQLEPFDVARANQILDEAGYARGADGIRVDQDGEKMEYEVITPTGVQGINRSFEVARAGLEQVGITLKQKALDDTAAFEEILAPDNKYEVFDLAMWDWVGYLDPDFVLSVVTCDQWGGWSDTGYCNPDYDELYQQQAVTIDQAARREIVYEMQEILNRDRPYIQLVNLVATAAHGKGWDGLNLPELGGFSKRPYTDAHRVEG